MTEDEANKLIETMFDELYETKKKPLGSVETKKLLTDAEQIAQMDSEEMERAVADFVRSWRDFRGLDPMRYGDPTWWRALEYLALANSRLKDAFCGQDRSPASIRQHHRWRLKLADGRRYRTDA
jgi:hypothetical protein